MFFGMRFSLASLLYLWCVLEIVIKDNKRFYWVLIFIPLLHYSFLLLLLIPVIYTFLKKKLTVCVIVFLLSFGFNNPQVASYFDTFATSFLPERTASAVGQYASEEGLEYMNNRDAEGMSTVNAKASFFYYIQDVKTYIIMFSMLLILLVSYKNIKNDEMLLKLFTMMLLLFAGANITSSASRGDRFYIIACSYSIFLLYRIVHSNDNRIIVYKNKPIIIVAFLVAIIYGVLYNYAMRPDYDYLLMCFGNPLLAVLKIAGVLNI